MNKYKAIAIIGLIGMGLISGMVTCYIVSGVAIICVVCLEEEHG